MRRGAIGVRDVHATGQDDSDMPRLAVIGPGHRLDAFRPAPPGLQGEPRVTIAENGALARAVHKNQRLRAR